MNNSQLNQSIPSLQDQDLRQLFTDCIPANERVRYLRTRYKKGQVLLQVILKHTWRHERGKTLTEAIENMRQSLQEFYNNKTAEAAA